MGQSIRAIILKNEKLLSKKTASICIIIIGMIVVLPFNYMYGIGGFEVDAVWAIVGIVMVVTGFYLLKNSAKLKPI
jgi:multidrug transporter EmrE-like cation transporter